MLLISQSFSRWKTLSAGPGNFLALALTVKKYFFLKLPTQLDLRSTFKDMVIKKKKKNDPLP